jgi:hypothetical protein
MERPTVKATVVQNRPSQQQEELSKEAAALQGAIDNPEPAPALDPELDPEDYVIKSGKNAGKPLGTVGLKAIEWYAEKSHDLELKLYANAVIAGRLAAQERRNAEVSEMTKGDSWGMDPATQEVSP